MHEVSDFSNSQFLEKMRKFIHKLPKCFANCKLRTANSNPAYRSLPLLTFIMLPTLSRYPYIGTFFPPCGQYWGNFTSDEKLNALSMCHFCWQIRFICWFSSCCRLKWFWRWWIFHFCRLTWFWSWLRFLSCSLTWFWRWSFVLCIHTYLVYLKVKNWLLTGCLMTEEDQQQ